MTAPERTPSASSEAWERLSSLYEAALSLPQAERDDYVRDACADDPGLRHELGALLAAGEGAEGFLDALAVEVLGPALEAVVSSPNTGSVADQAEPAAPSLAPSGSLQAGSSVGHFRILGELGRGGMGVVYRAHDERLHRTVAIKVVSPDAFASTDARHRLMDEARAVSALDDPNVCSLHAVEDTGDGGLCLVMSLCTEGTLRERLERGPLPVHTALDVARQLASGLAAAHRRGIVHRDLKPANVGFASGGVVKLLDFGVALRRDALGARSMGGTLPYMAPEVLRHGDAGPRADVWSLGVVLFEMLTGTRPFTGPSRDDLKGAILAGSLPALERADGVVIPDGVQALVRALLNPEPERRPADGGEVLRRLRSAGSVRLPSGGAAVVPAVAGSAPAHMRRRRLAIAATLAVAVAGWFAIRSDAGAPAASPPLELLRSQNIPQAVAVRPFVVRGHDSLAYLREGMVDLLTPALDATGLLRGIDPQSVLAAELAANRSASNALRSAGLDLGVDLGVDLGGDLGGSTDTNVGTSVDTNAAADAAMRTLGAQRYVTGSIVQTGTSLTLRATLRDVGGGESARATVTLASVDELLRGVDLLVRQLVAMELRAPGDTIGSIAAATTGSVAALRAFLDGERELRDARPRAAIAQFSQAVSIDSTFALAWYRLARAARWSTVDSLNQLATSRAFALSHTLPYRWQTIVRAYHEMQRGSVLAATRTFRDLADMYPSDVEVAMLLGEALFHDNPYHGRSSHEAEAHFRTVGALDMSNRQITVFLMDLAARQNAIGALDTLFTMYFDPNSAGEEPGVRETYLALHARRVLDQAATPGPALSDPRVAQTALRRISHDDRDLAAARTFARSMTAAAAPQQVQVEGWLALATLATSSGASTEADAHWARATALDPTAAARHRAMTVLAWPRTTARDVLSAARDDLRRDLPRHAPTTNLATSGGSTATDALMLLSPAEQQLVDWYLIGLLEARLQDSSGVNAALRAIAALPPSSRLTLPLHEALAARQWLARGDTARALRAFADSEVDVPVHLRRRYPVLEQHADRFDRAELHFLRGERDEAAAWYNSVLDGLALWGVPYRDRVAPQLRALAAAR